MDLRDKKLSLTQRSQVIRAIRAYFEKHEFLEIETPMLVNSPGMEPNLSAFETEYHGLLPDTSRNIYLPTSPEFHMKRLLAAGYHKIYQITRSFRNEEVGDLHNPEFTILEWYRGNNSYEAIMIDIEELVFNVNLDVFKSPLILRNGKQIDLTPPWPRRTMHEVWMQYTGIDIKRCSTSAALRAAGKNIGIPNLLADDPWEILFYKIFLSKVEPLLGCHQPLILYEYPACMAALSRVKPEDPDVALRFELYIAGIEIANAFDELTDPDIQLARSIESQQEKIRNGKKPFPIDQKFIEALRSGITPSAGIALGIDRLVMLMCGKKTIHDVMAFSFYD